MVSIGEMRHMVSVQYNAGNPDDLAAAQAGTWTELRKVWAAIEPMSSREQAYMAQQQIRATHKITIRYASDITARMRFVLGTRTFKINGMVNEDERNTFLICTCEEVL